MSIGSAARGRVPQSYSDRKSAINEIQKAASKAGRDISPIPAIVDPERRESCRLNLQLFCETYFAAVFNLAWSPDHIRVIKLIETAVLHGGLFAVAMPRGSGKSSLTLAAAEFAILYGHRHFVVLVGSTEEAACDLLDHVKADLETNDLLLEDFPEVVYPVRCLEGITHRIQGQLLEGEQTRIGWTQKELVLPTVPGSPASGSIVKVAGITGRIRGMASQRPSDGATIRPDYLMIDDPQTDESAASVQQVRRRLGTITGAILGLSGPGKKIAGVCPCTVIAKGDVADQILDRKVHPIWQGERIRLLKSPPSNQKMWEQYAELRGQGLREGRGLADATAFYQQNQADMDQGAEASWAARYNPDEASAIQHAMDLRLTDEEAFQAEYQNDPVSNDEQTPLLVQPSQVAAKAVASLPRGTVPANAQRLTAMVDVQKSVLFWAVCAWQGDFTGHVVSYGTWPEQRRSYFTLREISPTLTTARPGVSWEGALYDGLERLTASLLARQWHVEGGGLLSVSRCCIDASWGDSTELVYQACRQSPHAAILLPSHGRGIGPDQRPMNEYREEKGVRAGWNWRLEPGTRRHVTFDSNSWKTFLAQRLLSSPGESGNLSLHAGSPVLHRMLSEHLTSEWSTPVEGRGRSLHMWKLRPGRENHLLDCVLGCAVGASEQGIAFLGHQAASGKASGRPRRKIRVSF